MTKTNRAARVVRGLRMSRIKVWADRARALGCDDVADGLYLEAFDASETADETAALIDRARAALLLHTFSVSEEG